MGECSLIVVSVEHVLTLEGPFSPSPSFLVSF